MRLLILSANTGEGHNSAAKAMAECFAERGHSCCTVEAACSRK